MSKHDNHKHRKLCPLCDKVKPIQSFTHSGKDYNRYCGVCRLTATTSTSPINARPPTSARIGSNPKHEKILHATNKRRYY